MAKRTTRAWQEKRYEKLLSDPKHRPRKKKDKRRFDKIINLLILAGLIYGGIYMIPKKDKEEFAEMLGELPGDLSTMTAANATQTESTSLSSVLSSFLPEIPEPPVRSEPAATAQPDTAPETAQPSGFVGEVLSMNHFPRAYGNWDRTEFRTAEAAAEALKAMDRFLRTPPVEIAPTAELRDRKAALYEDGANLRFLIMVEAGLPAEPQQIVTSAAGPAPSVMVDMPSALREPRPEMSVTDAPAQRLIARARIESPGRRKVELAGIGFTDHTADPSSDLVDLRAALPGNRAIYVRGRAPLTVIEDFLSRANLRGLGLDA